MAEIKILLFHKDSSALKKLSQSLGGSHYSIISSSDLQYTLELARQEHPQFLIWGDTLNAQTKKAIQTLKRSDSGAALSVIAVGDSNSSDLSQRAAAEEYGVDDFISEFNNATEIQSRIQFHQNYINQIRFSQSKLIRFRKLSEITLSLMLTRGIVNICELLNDFFSSAYPIKFHAIAVDVANTTDFDYFNFSVRKSKIEVDLEVIKQDPIWKNHFIASTELVKGEIAEANVLKTLHKWGIDLETVYQYPLEPRGKTVGVVLFALEDGASIDAEEEMLIEALTKSTAQRLTEVKRIYSLDRDGTKQKTSAKSYFDKPTEEEILERLCMLIISTLHPDVCLYINYHEGFKFLYPKYCFKTDDSQNLFEKDKPPVLMVKDYAVFESVIDNKKTNIYDIKQNKGAVDLKKLPGIDHLDINHIIVTPLLVGQTIMGFFVLGREHFLRKFSRSEILEGERIIGQAAASLEEDQILKTAKLTVKQLDRIFDLGTQLTLDLTLEDILKRICNAIRRTLAWNVVILDIKSEYDETFSNIQILGLKDQEYKHLLKTTGYPPFESRLKVSFPISNSYFYDHKLKYTDNSPSLKDEFEYQIGSEWNDDDWIYVPIVSRGKMLGVISLNDPVERRRPNEERIRSVEYFANQAAVLIENYELVEGIKSSELKYRLLAETMTMGLVTCDSNRKIIYVNQSLSQLLKYESPDDMINNDLGDYCVPETKHKLIKAAHETLKRDDEATEKNDGSQAYEMEFVANDGEEIPFMVYMSPFYQHGKRIGFFAVLSDLRNQRKIERLKADFNSMIVHDLRSPLNIIQGYVDIVRTEVVGSITEEQAELLTIAKENVFKVLKLIDNFLIASKLESGHFQIEPSINSINGLIETLWDHYQVLANEKKINLKKDLDDNLPLVSFDKFRIEQVVRNFLSNALKFTPPEGTITLTSKLNKQKNSETQDIQMFADVVVKDTGVGIAKEELDKVFNKYEQTEAGKDASLKGTGLGLAICREIVELHNGNVWVESVYHKGSSFGFSLPIQAVKIENNP
jgi:PAS domain S-box-containing protein